MVLLKAGIKDGEEEDFRQGVPVLLICGAGLEFEGGGGVLDRKVRGCFDYFKLRVGMLCGAAFIQGGG